MFKFDALLSQSMVLLNLTGNAVVCPAICYQLTVSIPLETCHRKNADRVRIINAVDFRLLSEREASHVADLLAKYPAVVRSCFDWLDPW
ncbi:hypothetical protein Pelo_9720 [Pelomyxa schiedti]|nr:hypothetical protein Pelo_9720 [Pelomyxa schiedti]